MVDVKRGFEISWVRIWVGSTCAIIGLAGCAHTGAMSLRSEDQVRHAGANGRLNNVSDEAKGEVAARATTASSAASSQVNSADQEAFGESDEPSLQPQEEAEPSAGELLEFAFEQFHLNRNRAAADGFLAALATGLLNDAGRAIAYWHIYASTRILGRGDESNEALLSFVTIGEDMLADVRSQKSDTKAAGWNDTEDFVVRFDLARRVSHARAALAAAWSHRAPHFGRSADTPIGVQSFLELDYFLDLAPVCGQASSRLYEGRVDESPSSAQGSLIGENDDMVQVRCDRGQEHTRFFFRLEMP